MEWGGKAVVAEQARQPGSAAPTLGAHDDPVALGAQVAQLPHQALAVSDHGVPTGGGNHVGTGTLRRGRHGRGRRRRCARAGAQTAGGDEGTPRRPRPRSGPACRRGTPPHQATPPPGRGCAGARPGRRGRWRGGGRRADAPRPSARAARTPCRRRRGPRRGAPTAGAPTAPHLPDGRPAAGPPPWAAAPGNRTARTGQVVGGALVSDRELGETINLVSPQVDPHRRISRRTEHVNDRASNGELAPMLDLVFAPVAHGNQPGHQRRGIDLLAFLHDDRARRPPRAGPAAAGGTEPGPPEPWEDDPDRP